MGNLFKKNSDNRLLDDDYLVDNSDQINCFLCIPSKRQTRWKYHFRQQCKLLIKFDCFWASFLPKILVDFVSPVKQEEFQMELKRPASPAMFDELESNKTEHSSDAEPPNFSINQVFSSFSESEEGKDESDSEVEEKETFSQIKNIDIYDKKSVTQGILMCKGLKKMSDKLARSFNSYSNNILLNKTETQDSNGERLQEIELALKYYKWATNIIEKHLKNNQNILCFIKIKFLDLFFHKYKSIFDGFKSRETNKEEFQEYLTSSTHDLQQFIRVLQEIISLFYDLESVSNQFSEYSFFTKDNLLNFTYSLILNDNIYFLLIKMQSALFLSDDKKYREIHKIFKQCPPDYFEIKPELCLNQTTIDFFENEKNKNPEAFSKKNSKYPVNILKTNEYHQSFHHTNSKIIEASESCEKMNILDGRPSDYLRSKSQSEIVESLKTSHMNCHVPTFNDDVNKDFENNGSFINMSNYQPYEDAINALKTINFYRSPIHKLKLIMEVSQKVEESVFKFYKKTGLACNQQITGEEIINIFLYILSRCYIPHFYANLIFIEKFATTNVLNSKAGYYNATLQICFRELERMLEIENQKNLDQNTKKSKISKSLKSCLREVKQKRESMLEQ